MVRLSSAERHKKPTLDLLQKFIRNARAPRTRTMRQFAEAELRIPNGPFEGRLFRCDRQPYSGLWFDAVDSGLWNRLVALGPTQSGKTLSCFQLPILYHLFELQETVIVGLPTMDIAGDKWTEDIRPAIEASRYRHLLPTKGPGSRGGGNPTKIIMRNGATLRFMSGGGSDKKRAAFTGRVVCITETDGLDESGGASREADKLTQIEARTKAFGANKRIYMECTVSTEEGRTWQEYQNGSKSSIVMPCPHCGDWVTLQRENLVGWQDAESEKEAKNGATFCCPACAVTWSEYERRTAAASSRLIHRDQEVTESGDVVGDDPETNTLGFRWTAADNLFVTAAEIGVDEWRASRRIDEDNAEKEMRQFVWTLPHIPDIEDINQIDPSALTSRLAETPRGVIPDRSEYITLAIDLGKSRCWWMLIAWNADASGVIVDYGMIVVDQSDFGAEQSVLMALQDFRDEVIETGWMRSDELISPDEIWVDSSWFTSVAHKFTHESGDKYFSTKGFGHGQHWNSGSYKKPSKRSRQIAEIGDGYHIVRNVEPKIKVANVNADHWKSWVHRRLGAPLDSPGALSLFNAPSRLDHRTLVRHLTAEKETLEFVAGKGEVAKWERVSKQNHLLDCAYMASGAAHHVGVRLIPDAKKSGGARKSWFADQGGGAS